MIKKKTFKNFLHLLLIKMRCKLLISFVLVILFSVTFSAATTTSSYNINSTHTGLVGENASTSSYIFRSTIDYQQITNNFSTATYKGDSGFLEIYVSCGDGTCNNAETCSSCATDCGVCASESILSSIFGGGVPTYIVSDEQFQQGYSKSVGKGWKIKFDVENETHQVKVDKLTNSTIKIIVSSEPQEATLVVGDTRRFEVTGDDFYDLSVRLNSIKGLRANLTIRSIHEEMSLEAVGEEGEMEVVAGEVFEEEKGDFVWIVGVIIALVVGIGYFVWKRKKWVLRKMKKRFKVD